ncbi:cysteine hydrolase family protein [Sphingomonas sp. UYAg733]
MIDVQKGFDIETWGPRNNPGAEANIARLLAGWRRTGRPVRHVHHASLASDGAFRPDGPGHAPKPEAIPAPDEPIYLKHVNSAFIGTALERDLKDGGIGTLVIVGLTTNHCVSTSVRMAGNLGFETIVASDATAAFNSRLASGRMRTADEVHSNALGDLDGEFATVVQTADLLGWLDSSVAYGTDTRVLRAMPVLSGDTCGAAPSIC